MLSILLFTGSACQSRGDAANDTEATVYTLPEGFTPQNAPVGRLKAVINAQLDDVYWIDVRTDEEVADGSIDGAMHIDFKKADFNSRVMDLDTSKTYYMYCRSGRRSDKARNFMVRNGFSDVYNVSGGILAWKKAGYPLVQDAAN